MPKCIEACIQNIALKLTSVYETSHQDLQWSICTQLNDNHGYSVGIMQFTTGTGSAQQVISRFEELLGKSGSGNQTNVFAKYSDALKKLEDAVRANGGAAQGDTTGLPGFCDAWALAAKDARFRDAQLFVTSKMYWQPSQELSDSFALVLPVSRAQIFDSSIQLGLQGTTSLMKQLRDAGATTDPETDWIEKFLETRYNHLIETGGAYAPTVTRVNSYKHIVKAGNFEFDDNAVEALDNDGRAMTVLCDAEVVEGKIGEITDGDKRGAGNGSPGSKPRKTPTLIFDSSSAVVLVFIFLQVAISVLLH
ncbi:lysozyme-like domain-containing protein [Chytriomyces cf. hyalinus JEL632]|nr:lysozyme-like domain-containing protein [Chytriomyces cf. hyalinus JEL632]